MVVKILMVHYSAEEVELYTKMLAGYAVGGYAAPAMPEALLVLSQNKYSGVLIKADDFEYLPLLKVMRNLTDAIICVSAREYDNEECAAAIENGAMRAEFS